MGRTLDERLQYDTAKEEAFNRLYVELDAERKKNAGEGLKPVVRDLVLLHDHILEAIEQDPEAASALEMVRLGLLEVLSRAGAEALGPPPDSRFDRNRQSVKRVAKTDVPELDWTVTQVLREGFVFNGTVLRPQQVEVQRFSKPLGAPTAGPAGAGEKPN